MQLINISFILAASLASIMHARQAAGLPQPVCDAPEVAPSAQASEVPDIQPKEAPSAQWKRPRVFMALHGSNALANDASTDDQWAYVREHLDGIWGNNAKVSFEEEARLFSKITTRNLITEWPLSSDAAAPWKGVSLFSGAQSGHPELKINREAIALFTSDPSLWNGRTIASAQQEYVTNPTAPEWMGYKSVMTGWLPQEFEKPLQGDAGAAFQQGNGAFLECPRAVCTGGDLAREVADVMEAQHAKGDPFVWFASNNDQPGWAKEFQDQYNFIRDQGLWRENDVVMVINYGGKYPALPETGPDGQPADTVTGMLYWALHQ
jgi:hypothetical protein